MLRFINLLSTGEKVPSKKDLVIMICNQSFVSV